MMSKSKTKLIQSRPEPPGLEDVQSDLERAPSNDVAFTFFTPSSSSSDTKSSKSDGQEMDSTKGKPHSSSQQSQKSDIDVCYTKVIKFLDLNHELKLSQDTLTEQCNDLQQLGDAVKEQVKSLRTQMT